MSEKSETPEKQKEYCVIMEYKDANQALDVLKTLESDTKIVVVKGECHIILKKINLPEHAKPVAVRIVAKESLL